VHEPLLSKSNTRGVYPCPFGAVKWIIPEPFANLGCHARRTVLACGMALLSVLTSGCAAPRQHAPAPVHFNPIGVWYAVECAANPSNDLPPMLDRDFESIARAGLNAVFVKHCAPDDWNDVMEAAARQGLRVVVTDPVSVRFLRSGTKRGSLFSADSAMKRAVVAGRYVGFVVDEVTHRRARRLATQARAMSPPIPTCVQVTKVATFDLSAFDYVIRANPTIASGSPAVGAAPARWVNTVVCRRHRRDEEATVRSWLGAFHMGLARGFVGGVVFDTYRSLPGNWDGIVRGSEPPSPERTAMLRRIVSRAKRWCPLLRGLSARRLPDLRTSASDLHATCFRGDKRRFLLIVNASPTRFTRTTVELPSLIERSPVARAVTVSTDEDTTVGAVFRVQRGKLRIPIDLPPGEAELFELF